jgi:uncharacterized membrane protein YqiK
MTIFLGILGGLVGLTVFIQLVANMKIVGGNELGIVSGSGGKKGFRTLSGGRVFIVPLVQRFAKLDLTPLTIEVMVDSAIAAGVVPLNVKATVSFAIASNEAGRAHAVTRILSLASRRDELTRVASDIIEGHLRDSIASITPEQVMKDKDILVAKMINVCKSDLENIGLEITTMNIADVDDHRLPGVEEPDLYIALLKRVQTANASTKARKAQAEAKAAAIEQAEARRAETEVNALENEYRTIEAETKVALREEARRMAVGVEQAQADAKARIAGIESEIEAAKQYNEMLVNRRKAEIVTPALARREKLILDTQAEVAVYKAKAESELAQIERAVGILKKAGPEAKRAWVMENFDALFGPFADTLSLYPAKDITVLSGAAGPREALSAIHPDAIAMKRNEVIAGALEALTRPAEGK